MGTTLEENPSRDWVVDRVVAVGSVTDSNYMNGLGTVFTDRKPRLPRGRKQHAMWRAQRSGAGHVSFYFDAVIISSNGPIYERAVRGFTWQWRNPSRYGSTSITSALPTLAVINCKRPFCKSSSRTENYINGLLIVSFPLSTTSQSKHDSWKMT